MLTRSALDAADERTRVQRIGSMALSGIQGKTIGPFGLNVLLQTIPNYIARRRCRVDWRKLNHLVDWRALQKVNLPVS